MTKNLYGFGANIWLLVGALLALGLALLVLVGVWVGVKYLLWRGVQRKALTAHHRERFFDDGRRRPATSPGICTQCGRSSRVVYHMPDGRRLCAEHYAAEEETAPAPSGHIHPPS